MVEKGQTVTRGRLALLSFSRYGFALTMTDVERELQAILDADDRRARLTKDHYSTRRQVPAYSLEERLRLLRRDVEDLLLRLVADRAPRSISTAKQRELLKAEMRS